MEERDKGLERIGESLPKPRSTHHGNGGETIPDPEDRQAECHLCGGAGFIHPRTERGTVDYTSTKVCDCMLWEIEQRRKTYMLAKCELPQGTEGYTFEAFQTGDNPDLLEAKTLAESLSHGTLTWLTLASGVDRGKTHLAVAACRQWMKGRLEGALYYHVPRLLDHLKAGFDAGDFDKRFQFFCDVPLLVLDDLGVENPTPWVMERLDTIIDYRYIRRLPLMVTTNLPAYAVAERIKSRLLRQENSVVHTIQAPEYRTVRDA